MTRKKLFAAAVAADLENDQASADLYRKQLKQAGPPPLPDDLPDSWEAMTESHLQFLAEHGTYGQRLIAGRYLKN